MFSLLQGGKSEIKSCSEWRRCLPSPPALLCACKLAGAHGGALGGQLGRCWASEWRGHAGQGEGPPGWEVEVQPGTQSFHGNLRNDFFSQTVSAISVVTRACGPGRGSCLSVSCYLPSSFWLQWKSPMRWWLWSVCTQPSGDGFSPWRQRACGVCSLPLTSRAETRFMLCGK